MPPRLKVTKEDIIKTALELARKDGECSLNARTIAAALGCSTQPIFSNFSSMEELEESVMLSAYDLYLDFVRHDEESGKHPKYKAFGMAYIRFAREERELFKMLFMCDRGGKDLTPTSDFNASVEIIMSTNGVSKEKAELMHLEMWAFVHGVATMSATSFLDLDWELVSNMLSDVYQGLRTRHVSGEGK